MKKCIVIFILVLLFLTGCDTAQEVSVRNDQLATGDQMSIYQLNQPIPSYSYSPERDRFIQLYNFRMKNVNTFTVVTTNMGGIPVWSCPSSGYPLPADMQLTNPQQVLLQYSGAPVVELAEPNGLYSSKNTAGTWVFCVTKLGEVTPVYTELYATAFPFVVGYNKETGMLERVDEEPVDIVIIEK